MDFRTYSPDHALKNYIRYFWSCDVTASATGETVYFKNFADRYPRLVYQLPDKPLITTLADEMVPQAYICGIDTIATNAKVEANFSHFGVCFYPFALHQIFKISSEQLVSNNLDLSQLGHHQLIRQLDNSSSHPDRIKVVSNFVHDKINNKIITNFNIHDIILNHRIMENTDLFQLQKHFKTTERTLERQFKVNLGISPKKYQRIVRFEKSLELLQSADQHKLTSIAYQLNYTDQSHFIKDFKNFTNTTPAEFQQQQFAFSESGAFISKK